MWVLAAFFFLVVFFSPWPSQCWGGGGLKVLLSEWKCRHPASVGGIKKTQGHPDRHQPAFGEGTIESRRIIRVETGRGCLPIRAQPGCPERDVNTALLGDFRTYLLVACICSLWDSTMTQTFCFLWMETLGPHSQDGYGRMGPPLGTSDAPNLLPTVSPPSLTLWTCLCLTSDFCSKHTSQHSSPSPQTRVETV